MYEACLFMVFSFLAADAPADCMTIRADWFDRGNVQMSTPGQAYADKYPCVWNAGRVPNESEYDIDFPVTAEYRLAALYTAQESRPVEIFLDGRRVHRGLAGTTGSWQTGSARWETQCTLSISEGRHTIKLVSPCMPHICALRLESSRPFPGGWALCRKMARQRVDGSSRDPKQVYICDYPVEPPAVYDYHQPFDRIPPPTPRAHRILEYTLLGSGKYEVHAEVVRAEAAETGQAAHDELLQKSDGLGLESTPWIARLSVKISQQRTEAEVLGLDPQRLEKLLRHAVELIDDFRTMEGVSGDYLGAERGRVLEMLDRLKTLVAERDGQEKWERFYQLYLAAYQLKHRVALANPLIDFDRLLLAKRLTYDTSHIYTTYFDGSHRYRPGSGIMVLSPVRPDGQLMNLTAELKTDAIYRDPDLAFDAQRVLFSYKPDLATPCRIYEVGADGKGLRRITDSSYDDVDPCYLPNGRIVFVSTRCRRVTLCHNAFTVSVLHTMNADGSDIRCISPNTVHDFKPSVMSNGQITFTRWEYVDKHLGNQQSLWVANPDGTRMTHVAGNHFGPLTYWEPFRIPGSRYTVCILAPHMPLACGPVALVDPSHSYSSPAIYQNLTPELPPATHFSWLRTDVGYYSYAYPLSEMYFLVSYCYGPDDRDPTGYGIYLLDRWNQRDLVYRDPELSAFEPVPIRPRPVPPVIPARQQEGPSEETGTFYVADVYQGLPGVKRGEVKYLRVLEEIPKPVSADCPGFAIQYPVISNKGHLALKKLWGTVPVEPDGSAHFQAPANKALYFAVLDENFMEIQRMRSFTSAAAGERVGCIGCHERKHTAPGNVGRIQAAAIHRAPSEITPPPEGVHGPDFFYDVQPVLDRHCGKCHSGQRREGGVDLAGDYTNLFNVAYEALTEKGLVKYVSDYTCDSLVTRPPKFYGSHASKVVEVIRTTHREKGYVEMPPDDLRRLATWIDCNCPYYGTYTFNRPGTIGGRELFEGHRDVLAEIHRRRCQSCHGEGVEKWMCRIRLPDVGQSRPLVAPLATACGGEQSCGVPVFADRSDADYRKLLEVFTAVKAESQARPRADMEGSRPPLVDPNARYVYRP